MAQNNTEDGGVSILEIHDSRLSKGAHATFSSKNSFAAYGVSHNVVTEKVFDGSTPQYVHEISPKSALYNDYVRKLVNETHNIFSSLNTRISNIPEDRIFLEIGKTAQLYRSVLLACIEELHTAAASTDDGELEEIKQMFSDMELVWHLIQSIVIDTRTVSRILYKLLDWIRWHFVFAEKKSEELMSAEEPSQHPDYWDTIIQFLLQGKISPARSLLSLHRRSKREDYLSLDELLIKMPMYGTNSVGVISLHEFKIKWKHWQEECRTRLRRGDFSSDSNLETVCKILCGDLDTLSEKSNLCENWYHLMISVLLYTDPCIGVSDLADRARTYYNLVLSQTGGQSSIIDSLILAVFELDVLNVVHLACAFNDGWWFASHIMDLFVHGSIVSTVDKERTPAHFRAYLLCNYADTLMSHSSLWQIGIEYLDRAHVERELLEAYLERIPLRTENIARKIIYIAKKRNMECLAKTVANVMTRRALDCGNLGTALSWLNYSKDSRFADEIANRWMRDFTKSKKLEGLDIFRNLSSVMLVSDKLTFVGKYCEFHKLYSEGQMKASSGLLVSLIASGLAPPNFQFIMLLDSLPLLESKDTFLSRRDTYKLMRCLETAVGKTNNKESDSSKESIIRLALVRNLARAFVLDTEDSDSEREM